MSDLLTPASEMPAEARTRRRDELLSELAQAINSTSTENASNTPDFILANFAAACLDAFAEASVAREAWYGKSLSIDGKTSDIAALEARTPAPDSDRIKNLEQCLLGYVRAAGRMLDGWAETNDAGKNDLWKRLHSLEAPARELLGDVICFGLSDTPALATDVDALLADAEDGLEDTPAARAVMGANLRAELEGVRELLVAEKARRAELVVLAKEAYMEGHNDHRCVGDAIDTAWSNSRTRKALEGGAQ